MKGEGVKIGFTSNILMNKKVWIIIGILLIVIIGVIYAVNTTNNSNVQNYDANRTSASENNTSSEGNNQEEKKYTEQEIATYSTKIYDKDEARQNNVSITCNTLNGTIVKQGDTFSFCNTVGQATSNKGYKEAKIFDKNGNIKKGLRWWQLSNKFNFI